MGYCDWNAKTPPKNHSRNFFPSTLLDFSESVVLYKSFVIPLAGFYGIKIVDLLTKVKKRNREKYGF